MTELGIVMAGAGRHMVLEPLLGTVVLGAGAIELAGTPAQRETLLPQIAAGKLLLAFCHSEPGARLCARLRSRGGAQGRRRVRHRGREDVCVRCARCGHVGRLGPSRHGQGAGRAIPRAAQGRRCCVSMSRPRSTAAWARRSILRCSRSQPTRGWAMATRYARRDRPSRSIAAPLRCVRRPAAPWRR